MHSGLSWTLIIGLTQATQYGNNHGSVGKDSPQVAVYFPDPGIELLSPAFLFHDSVPAACTNGTIGPTSDALQDFSIRSLAERNEWLNYHPVAYQSEEDRSFPHVYLTNSLSFNNVSNSEEKVRICIQGAVHGNEPAGD